MISCGAPNKYLYMLIVFLFAVSYIALGASPIATVDQYSTNEDTTLVVDAPGVLANDTGGPPLTAILISNISYGSLALHSDGSFTYTPEHDFNGIDLFTYKAYDGTDYSGETTVTISVTPVADPPIASDDMLTTLVGTPLHFYLLGSDVDIDPSDPDLYPVVFEIISGPVHGTVTGDLDNVIYESPHTAFVNLIYTPVPGFTGEDEICYSVTDETSERDQGTIKVNVSSKQAGSLSGMWSFSGTFSGNPFSISGLKSKLTTIYQLAGMTSKAIATWEDDSFHALRFDVRFTFGELMNVHSTLSFSPSNAAFKYWRTRMTLDAFGAEFRDTLYLTADNTTGSNKFSVRTNIGGALFSSITTFTFPNVCFDKQDFTVRWDWEECDTQVNSRLSIKSTGFDKLLFSVKGIPVLTSIWDGGIKLGLKLTFTTTSKELVPSLSVKPAWLDCIEVMTALNSTGSEIDGIDIYGIKLRMNIPTGIRLSMNTSFTAVKNSTLTGYADYFERWTLSGPVASCCGGGNWKIATYFRCDGTNLFDWGMTKFDLDLSLSSQVELSTRVKIESVSPYWEWRCGINVSW